MNQGNQYHRFGYKPFDDNQSYDRSSFEQHQQANAPFDDGYNRRAGLFGSPLVKAGAFLGAAVLFIGVVYMGYPSGDEQQPVPVVQAEAGPVKTRPNDPGGMDIANRDSTIYQTLNTQQDAGRQPENLLDMQPVEEPPIDRRMAMQDITAGDMNEGAYRPPVKIEAKDAMKAEKPEAEKAPVVAEKEQVVASASKPAPVHEPVLNEVPPAPEIIKKKEPAHGEIHEPGASPDTIAFVRSVLDKKDGVKAGDIAAIEPAAGTPGPAASAPQSGVGGHYVQLSSVSSAAAAAGEWAKLKKQFSSVLSNSDFRVEKADLGAKGIYYRVQAGPFAEVDARSICSEIKSQKPGGCLVVQ